MSGIVWFHILVIFECYLKLTFATSLKFISVFFRVKGLFFKQYKKIQVHIKNKVIG